MASQLAIIFSLAALLLMLAGLILVGRNLLHLQVRVAERGVEIETLKQEVRSLRDWRHDIKKAAHAELASLELKRMDLEKGPPPP